MSHASILVAIEAARSNEIEQAVEWEMMPFDEDGHCFKNGSRWDWYVIGGRFSGWLHGKNIIQVRDINLPRLLQEKREGLVRCYARAVKEAEKRSNNDSGWLKLVYDVDPNEETEEQYLNRCLDGIQFPASYAFLQGRNWHEAERMGWFGSTASTECEIKLGEQGSTSVEEMIRRCKHKDPETGATIVCWNEPEEVWSREFYHRFIERLNPDDYLVMVDYHV